MYLKVSKTEKKKLSKFTPAVSTWEKFFVDSPKMHIFAR